MSVEIRRKVGASVKHNERFERRKRIQYERTQNGDPSITRKDLEKEQGNNRLSQTSAYFSDHHMNSLRTFELHNNLDDPLQPQHSEKLQHQKGTAKEERFTFSGGQ